MSYSHNRPVYILDKQMTAPPHRDVDSRALVDQIHSIDDRYVGKMIGLLSRDDYRALMAVVARYLDFEL